MPDAESLCAMASSVVVEEWMITEVVYDVGQQSRVWVVGAIHPQFRKQARSRAFFTVLMGV